MSRFSVWILVQLFCLILRADAQIKADDGPTESECRPYIEKALHELHPLSQDATNGSPETPNISDQQISSENILDNDSKNSEEIPTSNEISGEAAPTEGAETSETHEASVEDLDGDSGQAEDNDEKAESSEGNISAEEEANQQEDKSEDKESSEKENSRENEPDAESTEAASLNEASGENASEDTPDDDNNSQVTESKESDDAQTESSNEDKLNADSLETKVSAETADNLGTDKDNDESSELKAASDEKSENENIEAESEENASTDKETPSSENLENSGEPAEPEDKSENAKDSSTESQENAPESKEETTTEDEDSKEILDENVKSNESNQNEDENASDDEDSESETEIPEDELLSAEVQAYEHRNRSHISEILNLDNESKDKVINNVAEIILRDLRRIYENSIKPLELLYKYRDLSNRHFGDSEIFAKPLILLMGPWSAGKSSIINYLTDNENTESSLRSGAEPSPAYFNLVMYGDEPEVLDGTQLVADFTFSGLQKFGQGLEERLHGLKLPNKLLKKVNIVEIPGILEVRKQVSRQFPFNDACQWFIDRADMIFLVYDPSKLDVGLETEAILDQLKGREYQTRIILNKADKVKPDELLRVQSALMWNISPLMSSTQPPVMYTVSLWSRLFEAGAPTRLLQAQENALLKDMRLAIDKRIENKIASARRFAVRVRNHAKMVDCYLTTYYNHKSLFGNKKRIADQIIENPQNYHIYEGLSTLTNISRYDLPDPEIYRGFFHLNPLFEFKKLSETCTYFRGCPINKLDIAIAYDLPDLVGKYKKEIDSAFAKSEIPGSS